MTEVEELIDRLSSIVIDLHYTAQKTQNKEYAFQIRELANETTAVLELIRKEYYKGVINGK